MNAVLRQSLGWGLQTRLCELYSVFSIFAYQQNTHKYAPVHDTTLTLLFQVSNIYVYRFLIQFNLLTN